MLFRYRSANQSSKYLFKTVLLTLLQLSEHYLFYTAVGSLQYYYMNCMHLYIYILYQSGTDYADVFFFKIVLKGN